MMGLSLGCGMGWDGCLLGWLVVWERWSVGWWLEEEEAVED